MPPLDASELVPDRVVADGSVRTARDGRTRDRRLAAAHPAAERDGSQGARAARRRPQGAGCRRRAAARPPPARGRDGASPPPGRTDGAGTGARCGGHGRGGPRTRRRRRRGQDGGRAAVRRGGRGGRRRRRVVRPRRARRRPAVRPPRPDRAPRRRRRAGCGARHRLAGLLVGGRGLLRCRHHRRVGMAGDRAAPPRRPARRRRRAPGPGRAGARGGRVAVEPPGPVRGATVAARPRPGAGEGAGRDAGVVRAGGGAGRAAFGVGGGAGLRPRPAVRRGRRPRVAPRPGGLVGAL